MVYLSVYHCGVFTDEEAWLLMLEQFLFEYGWVKTMMNEMEMQEPERRQRSDQEWQTGKTYGEYRAEYPGMNESEPEQKIYPQDEPEQRGSGTLLGIAAILLSSLGFFITLAGIVGSAVVLKFANGQQALVAGGVIGLVSAILALLVFVAIFVIAVVALARPYVAKGLKRPRGRLRWR
jgi:hypothetical protein